MKKAAAIFLGVVAASLTLYFVFLFACIRCDPDDMLISLQFRQLPAFEVFKTWYLHSSFRFTLLFSDLLIIGGKDPSYYPVAIFLYYLALFSFFTWVIYRLVIEYFDLIKLSGLQKILLFCFSIMQLGGIYFLTSARIEAFTWIAATEAHAVPVAFFLFATLLIWKRNYAQFDYFWLLLSMLIIAGGAEHFSFFCLLVAGIASVFSLIKQEYFAPERRKKILFATGALLLFVFLISSNPGNLNKLTDAQKPVELDPSAFPFDPISFVVMFFQPYKLTGLLILGASWTCFSILFGIQRSILVKIPLLLLLGLLIVSASLSYWAYHSLTVTRIWFAFDVFLYLVLSLFFVKYIVPHLSSGLFVTTQFAGLTIVLVIHYYRHVPALYIYNKACRQLESKVNKANALVVKMNDFPPSDLLNEVALEEDPNSGINQLYSRFYGSSTQISVTRNK